MPLQKRYKVVLESKLEQLWHQGYCVLERWELASWFDKERITNVVWREIFEKWQDDYDDEDQLRVIKCDDTSTPQTFVIVNDHRLIDINKMAK